VVRAGKGHKDQAGPCGVRRGPHRALPFRETRRGMSGPRSADCYRGTMPLFEQGTDGHLERAGETGERDQGGLALGALELDEVEAAAADLGGQSVLG
jgi:hypothetical protein